MRNWPCYLAAVWPQVLLIPSNWRTAKVFFIPKPGKDDYAEVRAWRPISLMSFIFKTFERMLLRHWQHTTLAQEPMQRFQFGFQKGKSVDHCLSLVTDNIENTEATVCPRGVLGHRRCFRQPPAGGSGKDIGKEEVANGRGPLD